MKIDYKEQFGKKRSKAVIKALPTPLKSWKLHALATAGLVVFGIAMIMSYGDTHAAQRKPQSVFSAALALPELNTETPNASNNQNIPKPWKTAIVRSGDSLAGIAYRENIPAENIHSLMNSNERARRLRTIRPGEKIHYQLSENGQLAALRYDISDTERLTIQQKGNNQYDANIVDRPYQVQQNRAFGVIKTTMYEAALDAGLTDNVIMEMANIFGYDIDFTLDVRKGDSFYVVWEEYYRDGKKIRDGNILATEFVNRNRDIQGIRYTDADGHTDYYSPDGKSLKKAFLRSPVHFTRISSRFNPNRLHPIYKTRRPHRGVDYAARTGTPVMSSGDGKVIFRGKKRGYGNVVIVKHGNKYQTLYAHLSNFDRKAPNGARVKQGQVIGYVGKTGWATGPHLHYEFRVNGAHRNPLTVQLPTANPLAKKFMADFEQTSKPLIAQLDLLQRTQNVLVAKK